MRHSGRTRISDIADRLGVSTATVSRALSGNGYVREPLAALTVPHLRIYGYLDGIVPRKVVPLLDSLWPESESQIIAKAAHAPFISHPTEFCSALIALSQRLD